MNPTPGAKDVDLHNGLYAKAWALIEEELHLHGRALSEKPSWGTRRKLNEAISLFERTLEINPLNWNSMWALGKIYQRLNDHSSALTWFSKAHKVDANNAAILREATISAMR